MTDDQYNRWHADISARARGQAERLADRMGWSTFPVGGRVFAAPDRRAAQDAGARRRLRTGAPLTGPRRDPASWSYLRSNGHLQQTIDQLAAMVGGEQ